MPSSCHNDNNSQNILIQKRIQIEGGKIKTKRPFQNEKVPYQNDTVCTE